MLAILFNIIYITVICGDFQRVRISMHTGSRTGMMACTPPTAKPVVITQSTELPKALGVLTLDVMAVLGLSPHRSVLEVF